MKSLFGFPNSFPAPSKQFFLAPARVQVYLQQPNPNHLRPLKLVLAVQMQTSDEHNHGAVPSPQPNEDSSQASIRLSTSLRHTAEGPRGGVNSDTRVGDAALATQAPASRFDCANGRPGSLHLTPCTVEQFRELDFDREDRYELVEGVLVSYPTMGADQEHNLMLDYLSKLLELRTPGLAVRTSTQMSVHVDSVRGKGRRHQDTSSSASPGQASSSHDSPDAQEGSVRYPDVFIYDQSEDSENSEHTLSASRGRREPGDKRPRMVIEVTSTNRKTDLEAKRHEYEKQKIPEYVVIDRQKGFKRAHPCVIVHRLDSRGKYAEEKYTEKQEVPCSLFQPFRLTAGQLLDHNRLRVIHGKEVGRDKRIRKEAEKKAEEAEKKAEEAEKNAQKEKRIREEAQKKAEEAEKNAQKEKRIREEAQKNAGEAQKNAQKEKRGRKKAESSNKRLRDKLTLHGISHSLGSSSGNSGSSPTASNSPLSPNPQARQRLKIPSPKTGRR